MVNRLYFRMGWSVPVALSPEVQRTILSFYGLREEQVPVVYNGIDLSRCIPKEEYDLGDPVKLLHIGRFNEQKNHKGLLESFSTLLKTYPQCRLDLIGDGELREKMETYVHDLGIGDNVRFLGSQGNVYPYLRDADLFVLPSHYEGMPMTIIEAMGTGLPVVASAVGGVPDMIQDGESGLLSRTPEEFVAACERFIGDGSLRERLGRQAKLDSRRFSGEYMAQKYCEAYLQ